MSKASLVTTPLNVDYLTGFKSSRAMLLQTRNKTYLFTDARYLEKAEGIKNVTAVNVKDKGIWPKLIKKHRITELQYESHRLTVNELKRLKKVIKGVKWIDGNELIEQKRAIKTPPELRKIRASQALNEQVFYSIIKTLKSGITEIEIAKRIKMEGLKYGAEKAFEPIVAFGPGSSTPHHENSKRKLKKGDLILIDMGLQLDGYCSDMTRVLFTTTPTQKQAEMYELVLAAQTNAIAALKPEKMGHQLYQIAHKTFQKAGLEDHFTHALGHGLGLEIHERPSLAEKNTQKLKPNMVVTIEPGLYFPKQFGIRIEDMVLITEKGAQNLTSVPKAIKDCILA